MVSHAASSMPGWSASKFHMWMHAPEAVERGAHLVPSELHVRQPSLLSTHAAAAPADKRGHGLGMSAAARKAFERKGMCCLGGPNVRGESRGSLQAE